MYNNWKIVSKVLFQKRLCKVILFWSMSQSNYFSTWIILQILLDDLLELSHSSYSWSLGGTFVYNILWGISFSQRGSGIFGEEKSVWFNNVIFFLIQWCDQWYLYHSNNVIKFALFMVWPKSLFYITQQLQHCNSF